MLFDPVITVTKIYPKKNIKKAESSYTFTTFLFIRLLMGERNVYLYMND